MTAINTEWLHLQVYRFNGHNKLRTCTTLEFYSHMAADTLTGGRCLESTENSHAS